jgi:predicted HAD superfamily Cof-like phosphohydrolase
MTNYKDVEEFSKKFDIPRLDIPGFLDEEMHNFRVEFIKEELQEFIDSTEAGDLPTAFDSLIDLVYVAMGTAYMMGFDNADWQELWSDVQRANMSKERCKNESDSERNNTLDVIKPEGWIAPKSEEIVNKIINKRQNEK